MESSALYKFGKFRFDPANHLLLNEETPVSLTPKAFDFLLVLVENGTKSITKEELMQKVWPDSFVEEANLTVNVSVLRKLLGETIEGQSYIETVPKKGYRFVAPITEVLAEAQSDANSIREPEEPLSVRAAEADESLFIIPIEAQTFPQEHHWPRWTIWALAMVLVLVARLVISRMTPVRSQLILPGDLIGWQCYLFATYGQIARVNF